MFCGRPSGGSLRSTYHILLVLGLSLVVTGGGASASSAPSGLVVRVSGQLSDQSQTLGKIIESFLDLSGVDASRVASLLPKAAMCGADEPANEPAGRRVAEQETTGATPTYSSEQIVNEIAVLLVEHLGYCVKRATYKAPQLNIELKRVVIIRRVSVSGNWPLFEDEFLRQLSFRPGQRLPSKAALPRVIEAQEQRLRRFLSRHGYFDGSLQIRVRPSNLPGRVDIHVAVEKGKSYKVGLVRVLPMAVRQRDASPRHKWHPAISNNEISDLFRDKVLFFQRSFNTNRFKKRVQELLKRFHAAGYPAVRIKADYDVNRSKPSEKAVEITLRIQQRKRITVRYRGNTAFAPKDLAEVLTLAEAGAYDDYEVANSAEQIRKLYQSHGYLQARVRFSRAAKTHHDTITFYVTEGPQRRVRKVSFTGNVNLPADILRSVLRTRTYPLWGIGDGGYATARQLKQDTERLQALYRNRGFPRATVKAYMAPYEQLLDKPAALAATVTSGAAETKHIYVRFVIDEGPLVKVGRVQFKGPEIVGSGELQKRLLLSPGKPFVQAALEEDRKRIVRAYAERGYLYARVSRATVTGKIGGTARDISYTIHPGKRVYAGAVLVRRNFHTHSSLIRNALDIKAAEPLDIRDLERGEHSLRELGIFNSVRIQILGTQVGLDRVPILVTVEERYDDYGAIELGVGGSTDNLFFGALGYGWRNAFGYAIDLSARAEVGLQIQGGNINMTYPRLFGTQFAAETRLFLRNELTERLGALFTYGGQLTVSRELLKDLRAFASYEVRQIETQEQLNRPTGDFDESRKARVTSRTGAFSASLVYDKRDNPLAPTRGFRISSTVMWAAEALFGTDDFLKLRLNGQGYVPLPFDTVLAFGARYDHGIPLRGAQLLPRAERFFAGGDTTIRGFEEDRAFAEKVEAPLSPLPGVNYIRLLPQGGNIRLLTNVEFQFPIWKDSVLFGLPLYGAVFIDNGVIRNSLSRFDFSDFRHGLGGALRIVTLVGFLSIEYAVPLDPEVGDPRNGRLHLNFGYIF